MADQSSISTAQASLPDRASAFFSQMENVMKTEDINQWAPKLSETFESLNHDLGQEDKKDRQRSISQPRCAFQYDHSGAEWAASDLRETRQISSADSHQGAWQRKRRENRFTTRRQCLNAFHRAHRIGPRLNQVQLELIASACAVASHYPAAFPDDAYNIIADYLIAKQAQNDERMVEILASLIIWLL
jgi:hypothetical protein